MQNATRGGDLLFHKLALLKQNFGRATAMSMLAGGGLLAGIATTNQAAPILEVYKKLFQAHSTNFFNFGNAYTTKITVGWGDWARTGSEDYILQYINQDLMPLIWPQTVKYLQFAGATAAVTFGATWYVFYKIGRKAVEDKLIDGQEEVTLQVLEKLCKKYRHVKPKSFLQKRGVVKPPLDTRHGLFFGGLEVPPKFVCRNFVVTGGVGVGKSTAIYLTLDDLRKKKIKTVIYDPHSEYSEKYYRAGKDHILNPTDANCVSWDVFSDIQDKAQLVSLVNILLPRDDKGGESTFFTNNARKLLADLMLFCRAKELHVSEVYRIASETTVNELHDILCTLRRSESRGDMDPASPKQAQGIRSTLTASESVRFLELFPKNEPFSIRKWMEKDEDSWLFITSQSGEIHSLIQPYISTTLDIALEAAGGEISQDLRRAVVIDELDSAGKLPKLQKQLSQLRKFGVTILLGFQDINQLLKTYGKEETQSILTNCQTKLTARIDNAETAKIMSLFLGQKEVETASTGASWGANDMRDGESITRAKAEKAVIPARRIANLEDLEAILKLPGTLPPCQFTIPLKNRKKIHAGFTPAPGLEWDWRGQQEAWQKKHEEDAKKAAAGGPEEMQAEPAAEAKKEARSSEVEEEVEFDDFDM